MERLNNNAVVIADESTTPPTAPQLTPQEFLGVVHLAVSRMDELQFAMFEDIVLTACAAFLTQPDTPADVLANETK